MICSIRLVVSEKSINCGFIESLSKYISNVFVIVQEMKLHLICLYSVSQGPHRKKIFFRDVGRRLLIRRIFRGLIGNAYSSVGKVLWRLLSKGTTFKGAAATVSF